MISAGSARGEHHFIEHLKKPALAGFFVACAKLTV
jgi:hypothetical protein